MCGLSIGEGRPIVKYDGNIIRVPSLGERSTRQLKVLAINEKLITPDQKPTREQLMKMLSNYEREQA